MPNMAQAVLKHNTKIVRQATAVTQPEKSCNCRRGHPCPVGGQCLRRSVVYRAAITANNKTEYYTGITGNSFKERLNHHNSDFRNKKQRNSTTLSNHIWELKETSTPYDLSWSIIESAPKYNNNTGKCRLCNREKWYIMFRPEGATINDRSEFYSTCRHRTQNLLSRIKS